MVQNYEYPILPLIVRHSTHHGITFAGVQRGKKLRHAVIFRDRAVDVIPLQKFPQILRHQISLLHPDNPII